MTMRVSVVLYILAFTLFGYALGKPFSSLQGEDTHTVAKRQVHGYPSKVEYDAKLNSIRNAARGLGMTLCNGDPLAGVMCDIGENETCLQWREICDGFQVCGVAERHGCLQDTLDKYGAIWYDQCIGEESSDFCRMKDYQPVRCGNDVTLTAGQPSANISSPNYSRNYYNNVYCVWRVTGPAGSAIKVSFLDFATETNYDFVSIGRGHDYQAEAGDDLIITKLNGDSKPEPFLADTNELYVTFTADAYDSDRGFVIALQIAKDGDDTALFVEPEPEINTDCGDVIVLGEGEEMDLYSPNYPRRYNPNSQCDWRITVPDGRQVGIYVTRVSIEPESDTLVIGSGTDVGNDDAIVKTLQRSKVPKKAIVITGNEAWIRFTSDSTIQRPGFHLTVRDQPIAGCGGQFSIPADGSVVVASSLYPDRAYRVKEHCEWRFQAARGRKLTVRFLDYDTQKGSDFLSAGHGDEPAFDWSNYVVVEHSGDTIPDAFDTKKGSAWVSFRSDSRIVARGFKILVGDTKVFESGNKPAKRQSHDLYNQCGGSVSREDVLSRVTIRSPATHRIYPPLVDCYWTIDLPFGGPVSITFDQFQTEQNRDFLTIGNGTDPSDKRSVILDRHSGFKAPRKIDAFFQGLWIRFQSDLMHNFRGWQLHIVPIPYTACGGVITIPEGGSLAVATAGYPRYYEEMECRYTIRSAVGNRILFSITEFETAQGDELSVGEGCRPEWGSRVILDRQSVSRPEISYQFMTRDSSAWMYFSTRSMRYLKGWIMNIADSTVPTVIPPYECAPYTHEPTTPPPKPTEPPIVEEEDQDEDVVEEEEEDEGVDDVEVIHGGVIETDEPSVEGELPNWYYNSISSPEEDVDAIDTDQDGSDATTDGDDDADDDAEVEEDGEEDENVVEEEEEEVIISEGDLPDWYDDSPAEDPVLDTIQSNYTSLAK